MSGIPSPAGDHRDDCDGGVNCSCARRNARRDAGALDQIAGILRAPEWHGGAGYLEAIAEIITDTGRSTVSRI